MSSVILSTWVITLSTLSRYFPNDAHMYSSRKFYSNVYFLPAMITIVQALGTSIPYVCGTKLRPLPDSSFSNVMITFGWQYISNVKVMIYLNLRPVMGRLITKVEDEAGVHNILTLDPRNRFTYEFQFLFINPPKCIV